MMKLAQTSDKSQSKAQQSAIFTCLMILSGALLSSFIIFQWCNFDRLDRKIEIINKEITENSSKDLSKAQLLGIKKDILVIEKDKTKIQNDSYGNILQAISAIVLGITAYVGYQNFKTGEKTLKANLDEQLTNQEMGEKNLKATLDKQVTERFSKAIDHLGSSIIDVRLGGIYTLEQIAIDSPKKYHWTVVEILSAFIRGKCPISPEINQAPKINNVDIQAALTVIGRREVSQDTEGKYIDLSKIKLEGIEIQNANLRDADLSHTNLSHAILRGVNLRGANLRGSNLYLANLTDANLTGANLSGANLTGTNLKRTKLIGTILHEANLSSAILRSANLSGADLSLADLSDVILLTCENLTQEQLESVKCNENTKVPQNLHFSPA